MTNEELLAKAMAKYPKAKQRAVSNFSFTCGTNTMANAMNLEMDTRMYNWNAPTVNAIRFILRQLGKL